MPAFIVSINTPETIAGEYGDSRLAKAGWGSGGTGNRQPGLGVDEDVEVDFDLD